MYNTILLAFDGSEQADRALAQAKRLSTAFGSRLEVVHVYSFSGFQLGEAFVPAPQNYEKDHFEYAQRIVKQAENLVASLPDAKVTLLQGAPAKAIVEYADDIGCDLIVLGSRGLGGIKEFVLGSVSHNVVQHAKVPVLIVK